MNPQITRGSAPALLLEGLGLLRHRQIRWLVVVPLLLNLIMFVGATLFLIDLAGGWFDWLMSKVPDWLDWLVWLLWVMFAALLLVFYAYTFTLAANLVGSPFYGIIAERVMALERGEPVTDQSGLVQVAWRSFCRELDKLLWVLPRTLGVALLTLLAVFIPLLNSIAPAISAVWAAWSLGAEYLDYAADVDGVSFPGLRLRMAQRRLRSLTFGGSALVAAAIPLLNMVMLPASVVAGSLLWCREFSAGAATLTRP